MDRALSEETNRAVQGIERIEKTVLALKRELARVIVGQENVVELLIVTILARGHALLIGVPGLAKTLLVQSVAELLDLKFGRIQFTPDLMPSDIIGTDILEETEARRREFRFLPGPLFCNLLLADEINRTPPKTQSALLQAMQEHRVTSGRKTYPLEQPFFVLATQNPIEQQGTYPLPEAQLDRFMLSIPVGYPSREEEEQIVVRMSGVEPPRLEPELSPADLQWMQQAILAVPLAESLIRFCVDLARATRPQDLSASPYVRSYVRWGAGPRAGLFLATAARARAAIHGRLHGTIDDVLAVAPPILSHRIIVNFQAESERVTAADVVSSVIQSVSSQSNFA